MATRGTNRTGLAKKATIFAVVLLVSAGLCGVNFVAFSASGRLTEELHRLQAEVGTGFVELLG